MSRCGYEVFPRGAILSCFRSGPSQPQHGIPLHPLQGENHPQGRNRVPQGSALLFHSNVQPGEALVEVGTMPTHAHNNVVQNPAPPYSPPPPRYGSSSGGSGRSSQRTGGTSHHSRRIENSAQVASRPHHIPGNLYRHQPHAHQYANPGSFEHLYARDDRLLARWELEEYVIRNERALSRRLNPLHRLN